MLTGLLNTKPTDLIFSLRNKKNVNICTFSPLKVSRTEQVFTCIVKLICWLGGLDALSQFSSNFLTKETNFVLFCTPDYFWKRFYSKRKELAPNRRQFFPFRLDPFSVGRQKLFPLKVDPFPLKVRGLLILGSSNTERTMCKTAEIDWEVIYVKQRKRECSG